MAEFGNLLVRLATLCIVFWAADPYGADAQSVGQAAKPFLVRTIRPVKAPDYRPMEFGREKLSAPQSFTTYPAGTLLQLGGPRDGTCGESKTSPPDEYCVNGKETDRGQFDDQFLVDKSAVEAVDVRLFTPAQHFRAIREVALYDIPWGHGPILPSQIVEQTTKLAKGTDVGVSAVKGPYYQVDFLAGPNKSSAWANSSDFDRAEGPPPADTNSGASTSANGQAPETPDDFMSWLLKWAAIFVAVLVFCGWFFSGLRGKGGRGQSR